MAQKTARQVIAADNADAALRKLNQTTVGHFVHTGYTQLMPVHYVNDRQLPTPINCHCAVSHVAC